MTQRDVAIDRQAVLCELLVLRCQRGDASAFDELLAAFERPLFYYVRRLVDSESDAWDVLQETWLKVFRAMPKVRNARAMPAYLYATARNAAISKMRRDARHEAASVSSPDDPSGRDGLASLPDDADDQAAFDNAEQVHRCLDRLPLPQREALTLFFLRDLSIDEIAAISGVSAGTVKSRLHYGKKAIKALICDGEATHEPDRSDPRPVS